MTMIGTLGHAWRGRVTPWGDVEVPGAPPLAWFVAADDRWHRPAQETSTRQRRVGGAPVVETKLRVPGGSVVHTAWCSADRGGMTYVMVRNDSPLPIAVAFSRGDLWLPRPPTDVPIEGIELPAGSVVLPVGHAASAVVGVAHRGSPPPPGGPAPAVEPVINGWRTLAERASRLTLADPGAADDVVARRCDLALGAPGADDDESVLVAAGEVARMGLTDRVDPVEIAAGVERLLRSGRTDWSVRAALRGARLALATVDESRAVDDLRRAVRARSWAAAPADRPDGVLGVPWTEQRLVADDATLFPSGFARDWLGVPLEAHGVAVDAASVSFGIRWHGARPAVLWEVTGGPVTLTSAAAPGWSSTLARGEALWPAPGDV